MNTRDLLRFPFPHHIWVIIEFQEVFDVEIFLLTLAVYLDLYFFAFLGIICRPSHKLLLKSCAQYLCY